MTDARDDQSWMQAAIAMGQRGLGQTSYNPSVGCVVVRDGMLVGQSWTQAAGRPHAEAEALAMAGEAARGASVYTTLEPCAHQSESGPRCCDLLVQAGVGRVVIAVEDPDPRTKGRGANALREAGIKVEVGVGQREAQWSLHGHLRRVQLGLPHVTLKLACTLDGKIALGHGESKWITGPAARGWGHMIRSQHSAIVTGAKTVRADNPSLTARVPGFSGQHPQAFVLASAEGLSGDFELLARGAQVLTATDGARLPDPNEVLQLLAAQGHTRVMIEAGSGVASLFLRSGLVVEIALFQAPALIGRDGLNAVGDLSLTSIADLVRWECFDQVQIGQDSLRRYRKPGWAEELTIRHV